MTESEAIKICNTIGFATSFSNPQGIPLNTTKEELIEAMKMAISALEKQIPKKPLQKSYMVKGAVICPKCEFVALTVDDYCSHCGQHLDWSDKE